VHGSGRVVHQVARQRSQEDRRRRVLEVHPFQVALAVEHGEAAHLADRRAAVMAHESVGDVPAAIAAQPRTIREVHVFVRSEEVLVESAELLEDGARHQAGGAADGEDLLRPIREMRRRAVIALEGSAPPQHAVAGAVDHRRVVHVDDA
jgi:hypothetical protein